MPVIDMIGKNHGRLLVVAREGCDAQGKATWKCHCDCGSITITSGVRLRNGHTTSCGCASAIRFKHGLRATPEYVVWVNMRNRCQDPINNSYADYGGRGIKVCARWESFEDFYADMGPRPTADHQINRVDNDGDYSADNCAWVTRIENCNNRRNTVKIEWRGEALTVPDWARQTGLSKFAIWQRLNVLHWDVERTMTTPVRQARRKVRPAA